MPARCPELFVEESTMSVAGDLKFSHGVQDLKGRGNRGSDRWHRLACIIQLFVFLSSFGRLVWVVPFQPNLQCPSGKRGEGGISRGRKDIVKPPGGLRRLSVFRSSVGS